MIYQDVTSVLCLITYITFYLSNLNFYLLIEVKRKFHYLLILNLDDWFIE